MLVEIQDMLKKQKRMSLRELSVHFSISTEALEPMLELLIRKKRIQVEDFGCIAGCSGCVCANRADMLYYSVADE